jgi:hypothetical protein
VYEIMFVDLVRLLVAFANAARLYPALIPVPINCIRLNVFSESNS